MFVKYSRNYERDQFTEISHPWMDIVTKEVAETKVKVTANQIAHLLILNGKPHGKMLEILIP